MAQITKPKIHTPVERTDYIDGRIEYMCTECKIELSETQAEKHSEGHQIKQKYLQ